MSNPSDRERMVAEAWHAYLTTGKVPKEAYPRWYEHPAMRPFFRALPKDPRCQICYIPFEGIGGVFARNVIGVVPSHLNPHLCNLCERFAKRHLGGIEMVASVLFVDVRGSTSLAEKMSSIEFSKLIQRYYQAATKSLYAHNAMIEKFVGDGVTAFFVPAFARPNHAHAAIEAGKGILRAAGYGRGQTPWIPVGVGVNTGPTYIGSIQMAGGHTDITILGDTVNTAARLCSQAGAGELLISKSTQEAAGLAATGLDLKQFNLKGKQEITEAWAYRPK